jgi:hypothetical protein
VDQTNASFTDDVNTASADLTGDELHKQAMAVAKSDAERGSYAQKFRQTLQTVESTINNKLAYYQTTKDLADIDNDIMV